MTVCEKLRGYLDEQGIGYADVADRVGMDRAKMEAKLRGQQSLYADELRQICLVLHRSPEMFVDWKNSLQ